LSVEVPPRFGNALFREFVHLHLQRPGRKSGLRNVTHLILVFLIRRPLDFPLFVFDPRPPPCLRSLIFFSGFLGTESGPSHLCRSPVGPFFLAWSFYTEGLRLRHFPTSSPFGLFYPTFGRLSLVWACSCWETGRYAAFVSFLPLTAPFFARLNRVPFALKAPLYFSPPRLFSPNRASRLPFTLPGSFGVSHAFPFTVLLIWFSQPVQPFF